MKISGLKIEEITLQPIRSDTQAQDLNLSLRDTRRGKKVSDIGIGRYSKLRSRYWTWKSRTSDSPLCDCVIAGCILFEIQIWNYKTLACTWNNGTFWWGNIYFNCTKQFQALNAEMVVPQAARKAGCVLIGSCCHNKSLQLWLNKSTGK